MIRGLTDNGGRLVTQRICDVDGCERKHQARGYCGSHYNSIVSTQRHPSKTYRCGTCDAEVVKRVDARRPVRFCSYQCRDAYSVEHEVGAFSPDRAPTYIKLPATHPVRLRMAMTPLRRAFTDGDWAGVLSALEAKAVKVDDCWLWPQRQRAGYGYVSIKPRMWSVHRLAMSASLGRDLPSHEPVHHKCAEPLCFNPVHLQVVTPQENAAEMLERRAYQRRIKDLEDALREADPEHPALRPSHPLRMG